MTCFELDCLWDCRSTLSPALSGILKYWLNEIDRLIIRKLAYAIVTGLVFGVYVAIITLTTKTLGFHTQAAVAASMLAAVSLFSPLRVRVQRFDDRRSNRARYDTEAIIAAFTAQLRDAVAQDGAQRAAGGRQRGRRARR